MNPDDAEGAVTGGYGKPPAAHRFKPGQSGNPRGRPRKVDPLKGATMIVIVEKISCGFNPPLDVRLEVLALLRDRGVQPLTERPPK